MSSREIYMESLYDTLIKQASKPKALPENPLEIALCREHILKGAEENYTLSKRLYEGVEIWIPVSDPFLMRASIDNPTVIDLNKLIGFIPYKEYISSSNIPDVLKFTATGLIASIATRLVRNVFGPGVESYNIQFVNRALYLDRIIERVGFDEERRKRFSIEEAQKALRPKYN